MRYLFTLIVYTFSVLYHNLLGHKNWKSELSLMAKRKEALGLNAISVIMPLDDNLVLELVGIIGNDVTLKGVLD